METNAPPEPLRKRFFRRLFSLEGMSTIASLTSVMIVLNQSIDLRRTVQRDTYQKAYQTVFDLDRLFLDHPELKPYFYSGQTLDAKTDPVLRARVESTAEWISDFFDNLFYNVKLGPNEDWSAWESYIEETFRRSPALRDYVQAHRGWYSDELGEALDRVSAAK
jgi:hypothetical protein